MLQTQTKTQTQTRTRFEINAVQNACVDRGDQGQCPDSDVLLVYCQPVYALNMNHSDQAVTNLQRCAATWLHWALRAQQVY